MWGWLAKVEKLALKKVKIIPKKKVISKISAGGLMDMYQRFNIRLSFKIIEWNGFIAYY